MTEKEFWERYFRYELAKKVRALQCNVFLFRNSLKDLKLNRSKQ